MRKLPPIMPYSQHISVSFLKSLIIRPILKPDIETNCISYLSSLSCLCYMIVRTLNCSLTVKCTDFVIHAVVKCIDIITIKLLLSVLCCLNGPRWCPAAQMIQSSMSELRADVQSWGLLDITKGHSNSIGPI